MPGTNSCTPSAVAPKALLSERLTAEVLTALDDAGVPAGKIRTIPEVYDWEQVRTSMVLILPHPALGDLDVPASPLHVVADYAQVRSGR